MKTTRLDTAIREAERFLARAKPLYKKNGSLPFVGGYGGTKHTASVRRSSMDLTRALAELRWPDQKEEA